MEEAGILERNNTLHLFILHFIFLPRINSAIESFTRAWNKHPMRTERNWSPERIWTNGLIDATNCHLSVVADVRDRNSVVEDLECFGQDPHAPLPPDDGLSTVEVNEIQVDLPEEIIQTLCEEVNPCLESTMFGIDLYQIALDLVENMLSM